jgi:hypothetical protein
MSDATVDIIRRHSVIRHGKGGNRREVAYLRPRDLG